MFCSLCESLLVVLVTSAYIFSIKVIPKSETISGSPRIRDNLVYWNSPNPQAKAWSFPVPFNRESPCPLLLAKLLINLTYYLRSFQLSHENIYVKYEIISMLLSPFCNRDFYCRTPACYPQSGPVNPHLLNQ